MAGEPTGTGGPDVYNELELAWIKEHLTELRRSADQGILQLTLGIAFVLGLAAHIGGYALRSTVATEPFGLLADLLYSLGFALWTGVTVTFFVQVFPEAKKRQIKQALAAYDRAQRDRRDA